MRKFILAGLLIAQPLFAQQWLWVENKSVMNPSGLAIRNNQAQFQTLDWNGDGRFDFMVNQTGTLEYYENIPGEEYAWVKKDIQLPELGHRDGYTDWPSNFEFVDWDTNGVWDLAADRSRFWWNQGSNDVPVWTPDDSLLKDIEYGFNFFFVDFDGDDDLDAVADYGSYGGTLYINEGSNRQPNWQQEEGWNLYGSRLQFHYLNTDSLWDFAVLDALPIDPGTHFGLFFYRNTGTEFENFDRWWTLSWHTFDFKLPAYDLLDLNTDDMTDVIKSDWQRHFVIHKNDGTPDSLHFNFEPDVVLASVHVETNARPVFYDMPGAKSPALLVSEDFLTDFGFDFFHSGRIRGFKYQQGGFDPAYEFTESIPKVLHNSSYPNRINGYTLSFADVDDDGDQDYLAGFKNVNLQDEITGSEILFFQNVGTQDAPDWQPDSTRFSDFLQTATMFYDPRLIDLDQDGDHDLFVQKQDEYTFYERLDTPEETWQENRSWLEGISNLAHHSAVFADLTGDGKRDLIFGATDGTLRFYQQQGNPFRPNWKHVPEAFAGINVESDAAPAFADLDNDGRLDLVVGNADGWLSYYRNESTVAVEDQEVPLRTFHLFQNYPNPFNPSTTIRFELPQPAKVKLTVYNILGQDVRTLFDGLAAAGEHRVEWHGQDSDGRSVASGVYLLRIEASAGQNRERYIQTRKMLILQ